MERMQVKRPEDADNMDGTARFYTSQDLYIGATVVFNKWPMTITDMDEYAICYMEQHSDKVEVCLLLCDICVNVTFS